MIEKELLDVLACPACPKPAPLSQVDENTLSCAKCGATYAVRDGVVTLFINRAAESGDTGVRS